MLRWSGQNGLSIFNKKEKKLEHFNALGVHTRFYNLIKQVIILTLNKVKGKGFVLFFM